jgi:AMMECR1 domain-containing protein
MRSSALSKIRDSGRSRSVSWRALNAGTCSTSWHLTASSEMNAYVCPSVSLLTNFEDASSYLDWTIGVHGIYISFPHPASTSNSSSNAPSPLSSSASLPSARNQPRHTYSATYLPDVIPDQGWDKIEAVDSAIHKAGWNGRITEDIRRSVKLRRYQSRKCIIGWDQYVQWREASGAKVQIAS